MKVRLARAFRSDAGDIGTGVVVDVAALVLLVLIFLKVYEVV